MTRTNILPVIALRGKVAFPHASISFEVGREMTLKAVERASADGEKLVLICSQRVTEKDEITTGDLYSVGCVARIKQVAIWAVVYTLAYYGVFQVSELMTGDTCLSNGIFQTFDVYLKPYLDSFTETAKTWMAKLPF